MSDSSTTGADQPTALVTGSAGFIGFHTARRLLAEGWRVIGLDAMTDYYDVTLKQKRHAILAEDARFLPVEARLEDDGVVDGLMATHRPSLVVHLAAQAGVRFSIDAPRSYVASNLDGALEVLEACRAHKPAHLMFASTSSAYGAVTEMPYREQMKADLPMSFYAATKKANEAMAHSYAHLYGIPTTMFRFFTVYGPWGRPDMALFKFTKAILEDQPIDIYNNGDMRRDFTYIDDLVAAILRLGSTPPPQTDAPAPRIAGPEDSLSPVAPFRVVNIGNAEPVALMDFVHALEGAIGREAKKNFMPMQAGDVPATWADTSLLKRLTGDAPKTPVQEGVRHFVDWYREHYGAST